MLTGILPLLERRHFCQAKNFFRKSQKFLAYSYSAAPLKVPFGPFPLLVAALLLPF